jgi:hypothetical protein
MRTLASGVQNACVAASILACACSPPFISAFHLVLLSILVSNPQERGMWPLKLYEQQQHPKGVMSWFTTDNERLNLNS